MYRQPVNTLSIKTLSSFQSKDDIVTDDKDVEQIKHVRNLD